MKHFLSPDRMVANSPPQMGQESPPTTPSAAKPKRKCRLIIHPPKTPSPKKPKRGCRLTIHPPTQNHAKTQYLPTPQSLPQMPPNTSAAQKNKNKTYHPYLKTRAQLRTPFNETYWFPSAQKAKNRIRDSHFLELVNLGVTPLIHKCEDMGDLGLSGVEMEDEERGEMGEVEFGTGLKLEMEEDDVKRGKMIWLKEKLWGKGTWAVCSGREEEEEDMESERMCLARAAVPLMGAHDEDKMEIDGGPSMKTEIPNMGDYMGDFSKDDMMKLAGLEV